MKYLDKILFVICLAFYTWGFIDDHARQWPMIGGQTTFMAFIIFERKRKAQPIFDFSGILLMGATIGLICLQFVDSYFRG